MIIYSEESLQKCELQEYRYFVIFTKISFENLPVFYIIWFLLYIFDPTVWQGHHPSVWLGGSPDQAAAQSASDDSSDPAIKCGWICELASCTGQHTAVGKQSTRLARY